MTYESLAVFGSVELSAEGTLPTEIRLFANGVTETSKGKFIYDATARAAITKAMADAPEQLPFDFNHLSTSRAGGPDGQKAAGWFRLEARDDGVYAAGIEWTDYASQALKNREFRYFSPTFVADKKGRVSRIVAVALTNTPATYRQRPIVASDSGDNMSELLTTLGVDDEAAGVKLAAKLRGTHEALIELTGADDAKSALKTAEEWRDKVTELSEQLVRLELDTKVNAHIAQLSADGKLPPGAHEFCRSLGDVAKIDEFVNLAQSGKLGERVEAKPAEQTTELSEEHKAIQRQLGTAGGDA